jgi:carbonic anhydrase/acetyltransferase-like protein (isoleucine patch superfamily)
MALYELDGKRPQVPADSFVHPTAALIGDVRLGHECWIAPGVVIRAEFGPVEIGNCSNIQDNSVIHVNPDSRVILEEDVIIAHGVILHDVNIKARCIIGMGSILMFNVVCAEDVIVAAGSYVVKNTQIPAGKIVSGNPAKIIGDVSAKQRQMVAEGINVYRTLCRKYLTTMKLVS